ncbi:hypothetical protein AAFF_G00369930 [Aldrovandia affinis]|uniref:Uncharacterized protein n=1 Tax=Aldrovandia affinis TaxID=143900 RepID=A0AAD7R4W1_9TELE|nr:hypothetical protein AAFF_G00369930 [Aldrovandia affinis]
MESLVTMVDVPASDGGDCGEGSCLRAWNQFDRHRLGCVGRARRLDQRLDPTLVHCALGTQGVEQAEPEKWVAGGGRLSVDLLDGRVVTAQSSATCDITPAAQSSGAVIQHPTAHQRSDINR